ncbi:deoxyribose-phosphate aldolase [Roseateles saccharophilus]|uniref:Deoxyribose-phosphate aldolase n=1 Tax=Roseateles saccharophilus TaxID=304 RepID=A0A4R3VI33_ROSSA|nr:deoxyribose-phosphate aldolase [Roseateles saccharophilus]MDG0834535.1 deoxyribose-phosphate aldolase [Roseateles saccharophilus]TCV03773.1 deoxyribose-phosphate aldolase [Roseateles saccharophilus]
MNTELQAAARTALACLDLTSLNDADTAADIDALCKRAQTVHGNVAAVCVWPRFVAQARAALPAAIKVAAVANFPDGALDVQRALADVAEIAQAGGDEVDVVLPYRALLADHSTEVAEFLSEVRFASRPLTLKVIIESGELGTSERVAQATRMALAAGADFVKTSTGKTRTGATPEAAAVMLKEIKASGLSAAGFKASGGVRSVADAAGYIAQVQAALGAEALNPQRLRFGASGLLTDIEAVLSGAESAAVTAAY